MEATSVDSVTLKKVHRPHKTKNVISSIIHLIKLSYRQIELLQVLGKFWFLLKKVEPFQPLYNFAIVKNKQSQRMCIDRADAIYQEMKAWGQGGRILDIGCNVGYFSHYFADRGYIVKGIDTNPTHIEICKLLQRINRKKTDFSVAALSDHFINELGHDEYDIAFLFDHFNEILLTKGFHYTQNLLGKLIEKIPVLLVELTDNVKDEFAIFSHCQDTIVHKIGFFPNHKNVNWRRAYLIKKNNLFLCGERRKIHGRKFTSHYAAGYYGRHYYDCGEHYIKKYFLPQRNNNIKQILQEIKNYQLLPKNKFLPCMLAHRLQKNCIEMLFTKLPGHNLQDLLAKKHTVPMLQIITDVINGLAFLLQHGLFHNDIRIWNIMFDGNRAYLFDLGLADQEEKENTNIALLWIISQLQQFNRYKFKYPIVTPPDLMLDDYPTPVRHIITALQKTKNFSDFFAWFKETNPS